MISDFIEIIAEFTLYSTDNGGRKTGIATGYRPNHVFEHIGNNNKFKNSYIGDIQFENKELIMPGETYIVKVRFLKHHNITDFIQIGRVWWIHEALYKVGEAKIIRIEKE